MGRSALWSDKRSMCKGAFGKTSGRSNFQDAPLRATSSDPTRSMSYAIPKALPMQMGRTPGRVGFALGRKLLLSVTSVLWRQGHDFHSAGFDAGRGRNRTQLQFSESVSGDRNRGA